MPKLVEVTWLCDGIPCGKSTDSPHREGWFVVGIDQANNADLEEQEIGGKGMSIACSRECAAKIVMGRKKDFPCS